MNRIVLSILLSAIFALFAGTFSKVLYFGVGRNSEKRGFSIDTSNIQEASSSNNSGSGKAIELGILMAEAKVEDGKKVSIRCSLCHTMDKGGANKTGPNLWNLVNRPSASEPGFDYSTAMKGYNNKWTFENLARYLHSPAQVVRGTKMAFAGVKNEKELTSLLVYLATLHDTPQPLPNKDFKISIQ